MTSRILLAEALFSFATAIAEPTVPQVPCGCMVGRIFAPIPMRAPISYPSIIAVKNVCPSAPICSATAKADGKA